MENVEKKKVGRPRKKVLDSEIEQKVIVGILPPDLHLTYRALCSIQGVTMKDKTSQIVYEHIVKNAYLVKKTSDKLKDLGIYNERTL